MQNFQKMIKQKQRIRKEKQSVATVNHMDFLVKQFLKIDIYNTDKKYDIIYTDPAWKQTKGNKRKCRPNQGKKLDYQTCTLDEIK